MAQLQPQLYEIARQLKNKEAPPPVTVRTFLSWFGARRRGYWIVGFIRKQLAEADLLTEPDFESAFIDSEIRFAVAGSKNVGPQTSGQHVPSAVISSDKEFSEELSDPTYRISKLEAAERALVIVTPDSPLEEAVTLMLVNDYSQLPVMTGPRDVKGVISWTSIGIRMALGETKKLSRELMDTHQELRADASLFQAIPIIDTFGYVLVRAPDNRISGIVTASDLSLQFRQLAEPFILLGEIENHIRRLIQKKFEIADLVIGQETTLNNQAIEGVSDMTFGGYVRLLENSEKWKQFEIALDRSVFCKKLDEVRQIRNDIVHFDPDPLQIEDLEKVRDFARLLRTLKTIKG